MENDCAAKSVSLPLSFLGIVCMITLCAYAYVLCVCVRARQARKHARAALQRGAFDGRGAVPSLCGPDQQTAGERDGWSKREQERVKRVEEGCVRA